MVNDSDYHYWAHYDYQHELAAEHAESPEALAAEDAWYAQLAWVEEQDAAEARGGPRPPSEPDFMPF